MSKWKAQLDRELGMERKFHAGLEEQILKKANNIKRSRKITYPMTILSACLVALLIFLTWPNEQLIDVKQANFVTLDERTKQVSPVSFYISDLSTDNNKFLARANSTILGVRKYSSKDAIQVLAPMLQYAQLAENDLNGTAKDVVVELSDGTMLKLKLYNHESGVGILDVETKLYYEASGENMISMYYDNTIPNYIRFSFLFGLVTLALGLLIRYKKTKLPLNKVSYFLFLLIVLIINAREFFNLAITLWLPIIMLTAMTLIQVYVLKKQDAPINIIKRQVALAMGIVMFGVCWTLFKLLGGVV